MDESLSENLGKVFKIGVFGASGKMGQAIAAEAQKLGITCYWGSYQSNPPRGYSYLGTYPLNPPDLQEQVWLNELDVFLDFSHPSVLPENIQLVSYLKKPYLCGVTGIAQAGMEPLKVLSQELPVMWSSNYSLGVAVLRQALKAFRLLAQGWDFAIMEAHHKFKQDKPSGTAGLFSNLCN